MKYLIMSFIILISLNTTAQKVIAPEIIMQHNTIIITVNDSIAKRIQLYFPEAEYKVITSKALNDYESSYYKEYVFTWKRFPAKKFSQLITDLHYKDLKK